MKVRGGRALLNLPGHQGVAAIVAEVEDTGSWKDGCDRDGDELRSSYAATPNTSLLISDCSRVIDFEFGWETPDERENALHKVDALVGALKSFRAALVSEQQRYVKRAALIPKKKAA